MKTPSRQVLRLRPAGALESALHRGASAVPPLFYEQPLPGVSLTAPSKLVAAVVLGVAFVVVHRWGAGPDVFKDLSWTLGAMITVSLLCVYYATHTLRALIPEMARHLPRKARAAFRTQVAASLNDAALVRAGLLFGTANCGMALAFGIPPYTPGAGVLTYYLGVFLVGFICGMAVRGIVAVLTIVGDFARKPRPRLDYASPDGCGGLLFIGKALVKFSSVTLLVGVLIALYILKAPWTREAVWAEALKQFWVAFPFIASVGVLLVPTEEIHKLLQAYRSSEDRRIQRGMLRTRAGIHDASLDPASRQAFQEEYDYLARLRTEVSRMRTWPFDFAAGGKYAGVFAGHAAVMWQYMSQWVPRLISWIT